MKTPLIRRTRALPTHKERGVTMVLVALAMVAIIAMAALSIDVITLYLAKQEAQRSADAGALAAAKIIAVSGLTGDPTNVSGNWGIICGLDNGINGLATRVAKAVANQNLIGGAQATTPTVTYSSGGPHVADCTSLNNTGFGVNPIVTVQLTRNGLPGFFSRIWGNAGSNISATATAEVFNPSNSGNVGNNPTGTLIPVQPRCVKPWAVPNQDPLHPALGTGYCTGAGCLPIVNLGNGSIATPGISLSGTGVGGIIGETFWLYPDCDPATTSSCALRTDPSTRAVIQPQANAAGLPSTLVQPNILYVPGQVGTPVIGLPSGSTGDDFEEAIEGCDAPTNYTCGLPPGGSSGGTNVVDLSLPNPNTATLNGVSRLIHQDPAGGTAGPTGQDYLNPFMAPSSYPFQILAGSGNPTALNGSPISVSPSIVSLPIYDQTAVTLAPGVKTPVTFVGFLQVFINAVDPTGNVSVTVLNVAGCGTGSVGTQVMANSPLPVRLITPPQAGPQ